MFSFPGDWSGRAVSIPVVRPLDLPACSPLGRASPWMRNFDANARERLSSRPSVWLRVFRGTIGTDMADVVVAMGENFDLMYGRTESGSVEGQSAVLGQLVLV